MSHADHSDAAGPAHRCLDPLERDGQKLLDALRMAGHEIARAQGMMPR